MLSGLPLVIMLILIGNNRIQHHYYDGIIWVGGGYGMFSDNDNNSTRDIIVIAKRYDGFCELVLPQYLRHSREYLLYEARPKRRNAVRLLEVVLHESTVLNNMEWIHAESLEGATEVFHNLHSYNIEVESCSKSDMSHVTYYIIAVSHIGSRHADVVELNGKRILRGTIVRLNDVD